LLSPSIWTFVKPTWTNALIPFLINVASATRIETTFELNDTPWMDLPFQLWTMNLAALHAILDPTKLMLMYPPLSFPCHPMNLLIVTTKWFGFSGDECWLFVWVYAYYIN